MPGFVVLDRDVLAQDRVQSQAGQGMLDGAIGRGQVVIAGGDHDLHVGVLGHGVAKGVGRGRVAHLRLPVPAADSLAEDVVRHVALVPSSIADVVVESGSVRGRTAARLGSKLGPVGIEPSVSIPWYSDIEPADRPSLGFQQLLAEVGHLDPQVVRFDLGGVQAGVAGQPRAASRRSSSVSRSPRARIEAYSRSVQCSTSFEHRRQPGCCKSAGSLLWYQADAAYEGR